MPKPDAVNYQPLIAMKHVFGPALKASFKGAYLIGWAVVALGAVVSILNGFNAVMFWSFIFVFFEVSYLINKLKTQIWLQFASANGWTLDTQTSVEALLPNSVEFGHGRSYSPVILAQLDSVNCDVFAYNTTTGSGKDQTTHYFTIARVALPKALAHILLKNKKGHSADIQNNFNDSQDLQLEGDFNDYFSLKIARGQQIDALTILTPDVMQRLVSYGASEDIEINDANLYFILSSDKRNPQAMQQLLTSVYELSTQIVENITLTIVQPVAATPAA